MDERRLRTKVLLGRWFGVAAATLVILAAVGGWLSVGAYAASETQTEAHAVDEWRVSGSFDHRATVTEAANGTVFVPGSTVENRTLYFGRVMPVLDGEFALGYEGRDVPLAVAVERELVVRSVERTRGDGTPTVYWERRETLGTSETTVRPGERVTEPFSANVSEALAEGQNVSDRLESPGEVQALVVMYVTVERATDESGPEALTFTLPIESRGGVYTVETEPRTETFSRTEMRPVPDEAGPLEALGGPTLLTMGLTGLAGLAVARRRGTLGIAESDRTWLAYRDERADLDEWVTAIRPPREVYDLPRAEASTLAALVDFAIDTNNAVLAPPDERAYYVVHDGYCYTYEPPVRGGETVRPDDVDTTDAGDHDDH